MYARDLEGEEWRVLGKTVKFLCSNNEIINSTLHKQHQSENSSILYTSLKNKVAELTIMDKAQSRQVFKGLQSEKHCSTS